MSFWGSLATSLISGFVSILNNNNTNKTNAENVAATNEANKEITASTNEANSELANQQNQWNIEQWNRVNEYNSPAQQASRLQNLGLSNAAIATSISGIPANSLQSADLSNQQTGAPMQAAQIQPIDFSSLNIIDNLRNIASLRSQELANDQLENANKFQVDTILTDLDAKKAALNLDLQRFHQAGEEFPFHLRNLQAMNQYIRSQNQGQQIANEEKKVNLQTLQKQLSWIDKLNDANIAKTNAEISHVLADINLKKAQTGNVQADTANKQEENQGIRLKNAAQEIANIYERAGAPQNYALKLAAMRVSGELSSQQEEQLFKETKRFLQSKKFQFVDPAMRQFYNFVLNPAEGESLSKGFTSPVFWDRIFESMSQ